MQRIIKAGHAADAGLIFHIFAMDSTSTSGAGKASVAFGSWTCYYIRAGGAISGAITPQDITTIGTYAAPTANTNIRIKAVDNTNMIGVYELQLHLDWVATGSESLTIYLTASGVAPIALTIPLVLLNLQDSVRAGLTALPNAAAEAAGGLYTRGTGAGQINQPANGLVDVNVENWNTTAVPAEHTAGYPIVTVKDGTGTGEIDTASGKVLLADGAHGGTSAVLTVERIVVAATTSNEPGVKITGNGTASGLDVFSGSGATGSAVRFNALSTAGNGLALVGTGTGHGISSTGGSGATGNGAYFASAATNGHGVQIVGTGTGVGLHSTAITVTGNTAFTGTTTYTGAVAYAGGITVVTLSANSPAVKLTGLGTGAGLELVGGATGNGFKITGGSTSGDAVKLTVTASQGDHVAYVNTGLDGSGDETLQQAIWTYATRTLTAGTNIQLPSNGLDLVTLPANIITATSIAADAITAAKIADNAIDSATFAAGAFATNWTTALTEAYGTDGSALTGAQLFYLILAHVGEFAISSTTKTLKKLDGTTTAATYTLDSSTTPTSITRAT